LLPPKTEQAWNFLKEQPLLAGFVLIGGSALALRLRHRLSEDLDLTFLESELPRARLEQLHRLAGEAAIKMDRSDNEAAVEEFANGGLDLHDFQQDFVLNDTVKVSLFAADTALEKVLREPPEPRPRVATLSELFKSKCLVSAQRSKSRDWIDLYILLREHGFTMRDYRNAFSEAGVDSQFETGLTRLCSGTPQRDDEGYRDLLPNPPTLEEMTRFFREQRDRFEVDTALKARKERNE
jgi:predicted nucleotidyltransferase component of viral defense system